MGMRSRIYSGRVWGCWVFSQGCTALPSPVAPPKDVQPSALILDATRFAFRRENAAECLPFSVTGSESWIKSEGSFFFFWPCSRDLSSLTRIELVPPAVEAQSLNQPLDHQGSPLWVFLSAPDIAFSYWNPPGMGTSPLRQAIFLGPPSAGPSSTDAILSCPQSGNVFS